MFNLYTLDIFLPAVQRRSVGLDWMKRAQQFFRGVRSSEMNEMSRVKSNVYPNDLQHFFFLLSESSKEVDDGVREC